jgi:uncharacterized protein YjiK
MRHPFKLGLVAAALVLPLASQAAAVTTIKPALTNIVRTSDWGKPSPDPMGLTYRASSNTIFVVDSEVEETPIWGGVNLWEMTRGGVVVAQGSTTRFSVEPTDLAYVATSKRFFVSDDDKDKIFIVGLGGDRKMGTADDQVRSFSTRTFGSHDAEGIGFNAGVLYITDGVGQQVFKLRAGPNKIFDGAAPEGDDVVSHFGTLPLGLHDPEDVEFNGVNNHLYIISRVDKIVAETSVTGVLRKVYDLTDSNILQPGGITLAPATVGTGKALFIADRGYDNDLHPNENDGRIFEFKRTA